MKKILFMVYHAPVTNPICPAAHYQLRVWQLFTLEHHQDLVFRILGNTSELSFILCLFEQYDSTIHYKHNRRQAGNLPERFMRIFSRW